MAFIDYYKILGVDKSIAQKDVKKAYLKRAKLFHPDLHPDDPKAKAKFQALNEAYSVIGDPDKRAKYDRYGEQWQQADRFSQAGGGFRGGSPFEGFDFSGFSGGGGFSSFFENLFGGMGQNARYSARHAQPSQVESHVHIDMYTALLGGEIIIQTSDASRLKLKVKPGTQPGAKVRLRGKGPNGTDLIVCFDVTLPAVLTERQKELLQQMRLG